MPALHLPDLARELLGRTRRHFLRFILLDLCVAGITLLTLGPLFAWTTRRLIASTGHAAVSNNELVGFFLSPTGVALALVTGVAFFVLRFIQITAVLSVLEERDRRGLLISLKRIAGALPRLARLAALELVLLSLAALPGLIVAGASALPVLWGEHDINFYLAERPPLVYWSAAGALLGLLGAAIGAAYMLIRTCVALPIVLFDGVGAIHAVGQSVGYTSRRVKGVARTLAAFIICAVALSASVGAIVGGLVLLATHAGIGAWGIILLLAVGAMQILAGEAVALVISTTFGVLLAILYDRLTPGGLRCINEPTTPLPAFLRWRRGMLLRLGIPTTVLVASALTFSAAFQSLPGAPDMIISHRGQIDHAPENSLLAFEHALDAGADIVELDVQLSRDGVVVVIHDADLMRVAGKSREVADLTAAEITSIILHGGTKPQNIPTLREALDLITPRGRVLIELKYYGFDDNLAPAVLDVIRNAGVGEKCLVMSLEPRAVRQLGELAPGMPVGLTVASSIGNLATIDADFIALGSRAATPQMLDRLRDSGMEVYIWTIDDPADMDRFLALGVDGLITNNVPAAVIARAKANKLTGIEQAIRGLRYRLR